MQEVLSLPAALQDMCGGSRQDVIYMDEGVPVVKTCCAHRERMTVVTMTGTLKSAVRSRERGHAVTSRYKRWACSVAGGIVNGVTVMRACRETVAAVACVSV